MTPDTRPLLRWLATGAFWSVLGSGVSRLVALAAAILVARALGAVPFGELNLVQSTTGMLMALGGFGLNATATKFLAGRFRDDPVRSGRVVVLSRLTSVVIGALTAVLLWATAPWVARDLLAAPQLTLALRLGAPLLVLGPVNGTQIGILMGLERFRLIAIVGIASAAVSVPLLVGGAHLGGMLGGVAGVVASAAAAAGLHALAVRSAMRAAGILAVYREALREWRLLFSYSVPMTLSNLLLAPVGWMTSAFVAHQPEGLRELGLFAAANQWRNAIVLVATSAGAVMFPLFSHLNDAGKMRSFARTFWATAGLTAAASALAAGVLAALAPALMGPYGAQFAAAAEVLTILVVAGALSAPLTIAGHALVGAGRTWLTLALNLLWACVLIGTAYALRARGAYGLAIAHVAAYGVHLLAAVGCAGAVVRRRPLEAPAAPGVPQAGVAGA